MLARPSMFYDDVGQIEAMMHGHAVAFMEEGKLLRAEDSFNDRFSVWLRDKYALDVTHGWASAINGRYGPGEAAKAAMLELLEIFIKLG